MNIVEMWECPCLTHNSPTYMPHSVSKGFGNANILVKTTSRIQVTRKVPFTVGLRQAYKFDLFSTTCISRLVEPLSFVLEFCHKAENFREFIYLIRKALLSRSSKANLVFMWTHPIFSVFHADQRGMR